jgi:hypothetical protein
MCSETVNPRNIPEDGDIQPKHVNTTHELGDKNNNPQLNSCILRELQLMQQDAMGQRY